MAQRISILVFFVSCTFWGASSMLSANADLGKANPESNIYIIETMDGLPIEVELLAVSRGKVYARMTASGRKTKFDLSTLNEKTRNIIKGFYLKKQGDVKTPPFEIVLEKNDTPTDIVLNQFDFFNPKDMNNKERILYPGKFCLRIAAKSKTDTAIRSDVYIYWYAQFQDRPRWEMADYEKASLLLEAFPSDYLSKSPSFPSATYQGYVIIIAKAGTDEILWIKSSKDIFIENAVERFEKSIRRGKNHSSK